MTSINAPSTTAHRSEGIVFQTDKDLINIFDAEFKKIPSGLVFEQGGFIAQRAGCWELYVPKKIVRLKASSDIDKFSDINFGFYSKNRAGEEGILLKVSERIPAYIDPVFKQAAQNRNGAAVLQTVFFTADQIILHNGESFRKFILRLGHNGDLAHLDEGSLKALLDEAKYVEPEIDNISGEITDEYRYVPLVLEIEALGSPREILHGKNWREAHRTNKYVHTHLPTAGRWNELIRRALQEERDELNTPPDILGLRHDINRLNEPKGASSTIVTFEADRTPRIMRTFMMDLLSAEEQKELLTLASKHRSTLTRQPSECSQGDLKEMIRFYELVKKATVEGLPNSSTQKAVSSKEVAAFAVTTESKAAEAMARHAEGLKVLEQYLGYLVAAGQRTAPPAGEALVVASTNAVTGEITYNLTEAEAVAVLTGRTAFKAEKTFSETEARTLWAFVVEHETLHKENLSLSEQGVLAKQAVALDVSIGRKSDVVRQNQEGATSNTPNSGASSGMRRSEPKVFGTAKELMAVLDAEYKGVPQGLVFEQGGFLAQGPRGWELYVPTKIVRLKASSDIDKLSDINFGFYGKNRAGEEGILLKVSERIPAYVDPVFKQAAQTRNGSALLQTIFFTADQIILHNGESFRKFILRLGHNGDLAHLDEGSLKALLDEAKYVEPEIDNISGEITDEYRYVPLVLEIEALGSPREILHGKNWRDAHRTNRYVHTHFPTVSIWNDLIRDMLNIERDEFNTPPDILGLQHDINRLNAPQLASSSIVMFESDRQPRVMRTFMMDLLSEDERKELLRVASKNRTTLTRHPNDCYRSEIEEIVKFYELVKKATVEGLPNMMTDKSQVPHSGAV